MRLEYDPMNQVHPGPLEGIDRISADATQARTGNTEREQETWFAGIEEGQRRTEHNAAVRSAWMPIDSAPKDGTEIWAWRHDCGQFIASYTSADAFPMTQDELDAMDEETLFAKDWFTQWPDATRLDGSEAPTHWQPLPAAPGVSTVEQAQVVAWMDPDTQDVISAERKASWLNEYGAGGATKAATYTRALGDLRPAPAAAHARDAAFEAVRKTLCALPRYSFLLDAHGNVRRSSDRSGAWIEFDAAHELFDPVAVDAAIAAQQRKGGEV